MNRLEQEKHKQWENEFETFFFLKADKKNKLPKFTHISNQTWKYF